MGTPIIKHGKFDAGIDFQCGEGVVIDVDESVVVGNRCVLPDRASIVGRSVKIGNDFYGYTWPDSRLDIGRGRRGEQHAVLEVGDRCTFHNNRIDLAREVIIGNDVGLSPDVVIYTHGYWLSPLEGFPCKYAKVFIEDGVIVGFRSCLLPGADIRYNCVVGAQSVVCGMLPENTICAGNPAKVVKGRVGPSLSKKQGICFSLIANYNLSLGYRRCAEALPELEYPIVRYLGCEIDLENRTLSGEENLQTDDLRDYLFKHGIRIYTKRPFAKMPYINVR